METFNTLCPNCGQIDHSIDYYSHDEFSYSDNCGVCGSLLPNVDSDAWEAITDESASRTDYAMSYYER